MLSRQFAVVAKAQCFSLYWWICCFWGSIEDKTGRIAPAFYPEVGAWRQIGPDTEGSFKVQEQEGYIQLSLNIVR